MDETAQPFTHLGVAVFGYRLHIEPLKLPLAAEKPGQADIKKGPEILQGVFDGSPGQADFNMTTETRYGLVYRGGTVF